LVLYYSVFFLLTQKAFYIFTTLYMYLCVFDKCVTLLVFGIFHLYNFTHITVLTPLELVFTLPNTNILFLIEFTKTGIFYCRNITVYSCFIAKHVNISMAYTKPIEICMHNLYISLVQSFIMLTCVVIFNTGVSIYVYWY